MAKTGTIERAFDELKVFLRDFPEKELAFRFGVTERAARGWRGGNPPDSKYLMGMLLEWGAPLITRLSCGFDTSPEAKLEAARALTRDAEIQIRRNTEIARRAIENAEKRLVRCGFPSLESGNSGGGGGEAVGRVDGTTGVGVGTAVGARPGLRKAAKGAGAALMLAASLATAAAHNDAMAQTRVVRGRVEITQGVV